MRETCAGRAGDPAGPPPPLPRVAMGTVVLAHVHAGDARTAKGVGHVTCVVFVAISRLALSDGRGMDDYDELYVAQRRDAADRQRELYRAAV